MLKHEEMIENVHRRIAQYEEEKKMKHSKFKKIISVIKPKTNKEDSQRNEDEYIEIASGTERIEASHRMLRIVSTAAAGAVLVTGIGVTGMLFRNNRTPKPAITEEESNLDEIETTSMPAQIISGNPFSVLLSCKYDLLFPNLEFTDSMREKITELFDSQESWRVAANYSRFLHYDNGGAYSPLSQRIILCSDNYCLQICDDNIIEYAFLEGTNWKKKFYECDSLALIKGIADIMESEFEDNGVDFDEDVSDFMKAEASGSTVELTPIQQTMLKLCMKGSSWKMETMEANRDSSQYDISLVSQSSGRLDLIGDNIYADSNTGFALFTDKNGITYTCENNVYFSNNLMYIMSAYDYPDLKTEITITDGDGKELISANDEISAQLEHFIYYDFPAMRTNKNGYDYPNEHDTNMYSIGISYSSGTTELRTESYSISNFGNVERLDYVLDPVYKWAPAGCFNYSVDISAFESKLNELLKQKNDPKTPENKEEKKADEAQPTTESSKNENKPANNENKQDKPSDNEEKGQETNGTPEPAQDNQQTTYDPQQYHDEVFVPTPHTAIWYDEDSSDSEETLLASCLTYDNNALDKFMTEIFEPLLEYEDPMGHETRNSSSTYGYSLFRLYETNKTYLSDTDIYIKQDGYYVGNDGYGGVCNYIYVNGEWEPAGCENFHLDFAKFEEMLKEFLENEKLSEK